MPTVKGVSIARRNDWTVFFMFQNSGNSQGRRVGFWRCTHEKKSSGVCLKLGGSGASSPRILGLGNGISCFFPGHFQWINTKENAVVTCLFYPPLVSPVRYSVYGKKSKTATLSINEVTKDKKSTLKTGKLTLHVSTSLCLSLCAELQETSISHL